MAFDAKIRLSSDTSRVDAGIAGVQRKIGGLSSRMGSAIGGLFAIGTITAGIKNMIDFASSTQDAADRLGITIERVQELKTAAMLAGKDLGVFENAFKNIEIAAQAAVDGNKTAMESFNKLGITSQDVKTKNKNDLLTMAVKNAAAMPDRANAQMYLGNLVGQKGGTAGSLIGMSNSIVNPASTGVTPVDDETIAALDEAGDKLDLFVERLRNEAMPVLITVATAVMDFFTKLGQGFNVVFGYVYGLLEKIGDSPIVKAALKISGGVVDATKAAWGGVTGKTSLKDAAKGYVGGLSQVGSGMMDIGDITGKNIVTQVKAIGDVIQGNKSIGEAIDGVFHDTVANVFGDDAVKLAEETAASAGQDALDADAKRQAALDAKRAARKAKRDALNGKVDRQGKIDGKGTAEKNVVDANMGGPSGVSYGNLIGVNAKYRLERLSEETNHYLELQLEQLQQINANIVANNTPYLAPTE